jgi:glutamine synthetase
MGKRVDVENWPAIQQDGLPMPDFHLVAGPENRPYLDMVVTGPNTGFRNGLLRPDLQTIKRLPWQPDTALVIADADTGDDRRGLTALFASELEFNPLRSSDDEADAADFRGLVLSYHRRGDNDVVIAGYDEPGDR